MKIAAYRGALVEVSVSESVTGTASGGFSGVGGIFAAELEVRRLCGTGIAGLASLVVEERPSDALCQCTARSTTKAFLLPVSRRYLALREHGLC